MLKFFDEYIGKVIKALPDSVVFKNGFPTDASIVGARINREYQFLCVAGKAELFHIPELAVKDFLEDIKAWIALKLNSAGGVQAQMADKVRRYGLTGVDFTKKYIEVSYTETNAMGIRRTISQRFFLSEFE